MISITNIVNIAKRDIKSAFSKGVFHLFSSTILSQGVTFLTGIVVARLLGPSDYGHLRVLGAILGIAGVLGGFGMDSAIAKYVSEFQLEQLRKKVLSQGTLFAFLTALLISSILFLLTQDVGIIKDEVVRYYLRFVCWTLPCLIITSNILCYFQGEKQIKKMAVIQFITQLFKFIIICSLTYCWLLKGFVVAKILSDVIVGLTLLWLIRRTLVVSWDFEIFIKIAKFGSFAFMASSFAIIISTVDTLCISTILKDSALVGYYGVGMMISTGLVLIPGTLLRVTFPYLSEKSEDLLEIWYRLRWLSKRIALIMGFICIITFILAPWLIIIFFGKEYQSSVDILRISLVGTFIYSLMTVSGTILVSIARVDINFYITLISGIFNIIMNILLIRRFGIIGAAWSTVSTYGLNLTIGILWWLNLYNQKIRIRLRCKD